MNSPSELVIDLSALVCNWRQLCSLAPGAECAAVVKANGYGLGAQQVVRALAEAGCRSFYVATFAEALDVEPALPPQGRVLIFNGIDLDNLAEARRRNFIPVLSTLAQIEAWQEANCAEQCTRVCAIHVDTGMNRLGLETPEWQQVLSNYRAADLGVQWIMSHLACAEERQHALNLRQLDRFRVIVAEAQRWGPGIKASFANSSGVLLGPEFHFDQIRPGIALYGGNPEQGPNRFRAVVHLRLPVLQLRQVSRDGSVGYAASAEVKAGALLATTQGGYADGLLVAQSRQGAGAGEIAGIRVPMLGRISMDLSIFDVSAVPDTVWQQAGPHFIEVLNDRLTVDSMAQAAGTISYEVLTRLGQRFKRSYVTAPLGAKQREIYEH